MLSQHYFDVIKFHTGQELKSKFLICFVVVVESEKYNKYLGQKIDLKSMWLLTSASS